MNGTQEAEAGRLPIQSQLRRYSDILFQKTESTWVSFFLVTYGSSPSTPSLRAFSTDQTQIPLDESDLFETHTLLFPWLICCTASCSEFPVVPEESPLSFPEAFPHWSPLWPTRHRKV